MKSLLYCRFFPKTWRGFKPLSPPHQLLMCVSLNLCAVFITLVKSWWRKSENDINMWCMWPEGPMDTAQRAPCTVRSARLSRVASLNLWWMWPCQLRSSRCTVTLKLKGEFRASAIWELRWKCGFSSIWEFIWFKIRKTSVTTVDDNWLKVRFVGLHLRPF